MAPPSSSPSRPRVLVVDDNETNRELVIETLALEAIDVVTADSGAAALAAFAAAPCDCVLLDVRMPGLDGFATLERLRALPGGEDVPVMFLTALRDVETFDRARTTGAADFLTKPVRPSELLARVETLLRLRRLGSEVRAHLEALRRQRDDLMRLSLQKERLSAFVVHDLKNPVAAMQMHATVLARSKNVSPEERDSALIIREQCDRLRDLVLNLLDLSQADEGSLVVRRAPVDLGALLRDVASGLAVRADEREIRLAVAAPAPAPEVPVDRDLVRRMVENLADNALRHTPRGGQVRLELELVDEGVELRVADTGDGVPPELRERIFDPFVQLEAGAGATRSGRGLGLAFCRAAVVAHGGSIEVQPAAPGTVFVARLPR